MPRSIRNALVVLALSVLAFCGGLAARSPASYAQDSMFSTASVRSTTLTGIVTSDGSANVSLVTTASSAGLCPCLDGNFINNGANAVLVKIRSMPSGHVVRIFLLPPTPSDATMDSVQTMHGDGGESLIMTITGQAAGTDVQFAGDSWYLPRGT